jgi:hypothetical protein
VTRNVKVAFVLLGTSFVLINAAAFTRGSFPRLALGFAIADAVVLPFLAWFAWRVFRERRG